MPALRFDQTLKEPVRICVPWREWQRSASVHRGAELVRHVRDGPTASALTLPSADPGPIHEGRERVDAVILELPSPSATTTTRMRASALLHELALQRTTSSALMVDRSATA